MLADNLTIKSLAKRFREPTECEFPLSMFNIFFSFLFPWISFSPSTWMCLVSAIVSLVDAHKFIIRNLSSSETLNRIKDNKLEISGWTIYDCWRFHVHEKKRSERAAQRMATHRFKYHTWAYELRQQQTVKENSKQLEYYRRRTNKEIWWLLLLLELLGLSTPL